MNTEMKDAMREFWGEYKMAAYQNKKYTWNDMVAEEKYHMNLIGQCNKVRVYRMNKFANGLIDMFGKEKAKVLLGTIGNLDKNTLTGYIVMEEDNIKKMTVKALKADIDELIAEDE